MREMMNILKALADENRVRIVLVLRDRELCVCQITELLGLAQSTVSKHMAILKQARLVESRKDGRWIYYRGADTTSPPEALAMTKLLTETLQDDPQQQEDIKKIVAIQKIDLETLCNR